MNGVLFKLTQEDRDIKTPNTDSTKFIEVVEVRVTNIVMYSAPGGHLVTPR